MENIIIFACDTRPTRDSTRKLSTITLLSLTVAELERENPHINKKGTFNRTFKF